MLDRSKLDLSYLDRPIEERLAEAKLDYKKRLAEEVNLPTRDKVIDYLRDHLNFEETKRRLFRAFHYRKDLTLVYQELIKSKVIHEYGSGKRNDPAMVQLVSQPNQSNQEGQLDTQQPAKSIKPVHVLNRPLGPALSILIDFPEYVYHPGPDFVRFATNLLINGYVSLDDDPAKILGQLSDHLSLALSQYQPIDSIRTDQK